MNNLPILNKEQASEESKKIFNSLEDQLGMIPNVYAAIGNSGHALNGLMQLNNHLSKGEFSGKEIETVALAVAQENNCEYCLAAHTASGKQQGLSENDTLAIRNGTISDTKLKALIDLAKAITGTRGRPDQDLIDSFHDAGYNKAALSELIGLVAVNTITNYTNHIADTEIDFPKAPELQEEVA